MACTIDYWETRGEKGSQWTPCCLTCGWYGGDGTRPEAEEEGLLHREGQRRPWQLAPGTGETWAPGDPTLRFS